MSKSLIPFFISFIMLISTFSLSAQPETSRWSAETGSENPAKSAASKSGGQRGILSNIQKAYKLVWSDYDGDNCPFEPSCSFFLVEAVDKAGLIKGALSFSDRFMRDLNPIKKAGVHTLSEKGKILDPVNLRINNSQEIFRTLIESRTHFYFHQMERQR